MASILDAGGGLTIASGDIPNLQVFHLKADNSLFGTNELISNLNATPTQIALAAGDNVDIVSDDTDDSSAGTGAQSVWISGCAADYSYQSETLSLNGTTPVVSANKYIHINECYVTAVGTQLACDGQLTLADVTNSNSLGIIEADDTQIRNCQWMVPLGHTAYVYGFWASVTPEGTTSDYPIIKLQVSKTNFTGTINSEVYSTEGQLVMAEIDSNLTPANTTNGGPHTFEFPGGIPLVVPEKSIVRIVGTTLSSSAACIAGFTMAVMGQPNTRTVQTNS